MMAARLHGIGAGFTVDRVPVTRLVSDEILVEVSAKTRNRLGYDRIVVSTGS